MSNDINQRLRRLLSPSTIISAGAIVIGFHVGFQISLELSRRAIIASGFGIIQTEWERVMGMLGQAFTPTVYTVLVFYLASVLLHPTDRSTARRIRRMARKELAATSLSDREIEIWNQVLEEAIDDG